MKRLISYIFPIYNEEGNIGLLYETMRDLLASVSKYDFELIFINDGSSDTSLEQLLQLQQRDKRVTVIDFSRNFGHQLAVTAGLDYAQGDAVIIMDSDMQDPPKVSLELIQKWEEGYEVVYAQRRTRKDSFFKKATATLFYRLLSRIAEINIPRDTGDFRLLDKKVVAAIVRFKERNRFLRGLVSYAGFKQIGVSFDRDERHAGASGYPLKKMIRFALDGILSFSTFPLKLATQIGFIVATLSFLGGIYAIVLKLFFSSSAVPGWTFLAVSVLFCSGIQMLLLGIIGEYIGRIFTEVQDRPLYLINEIYSYTAKNNA